MQTEPLLSAYLFNTDLYLSSAAFFINLTARRRRAGRILIVIRLRARQSWFYLGRITGVVNEISM